MSKLVISSPALENAVKEKFSTHTPERRFGRSSLNELRPARSGDEYTGYFKIVPKGINETGGAVFEIINGHDPEGQYCGYTDVPGCESVAKKTFAVYEGSVRVSLEVHAIRDNDENSTLYYKVVFRTDDQSEQGFESVLIGYAYENGKVEQVYTEDEVWHLRRDWFL